MHNLDIIYRVSDRGDVHPERGKRFVDVDRPTLIKKCFISLVKSITLASVNYNIKLHIVSDGTSKEVLDFISDILSRYNITYSIHHCEIEGYNFSALKQFELCKLGREWVYSVEDDYLHFPEAINVMMEEALEFSNRFSTPVALRPDDDIFTYSTNSPHGNMACRVFQGKNRHWRSLKGTHNTFFTHKIVLENYWDVFASLAKFFRVLSINEDKSINMVWSNGVSEDGVVPLLSPIPTLAIHISQGNEPPLVNWKELWNSIEV